MAGYGYDTASQAFTVTLPDGGEVVVTDWNDDVNGFDWSATYRGGPVALKVEQHTYIDGIYEQEG
jgi:hypothetical protein